MFDTESTWSFQSTEHGSADSQISVINIVLLVDNNEREMIPNVAIKRDVDDSVCMGPLLNEIENRGYTLQDTQVFYYSIENDWFVFCGRYPCLTICSVPDRELDVDCLTLKVKHPHEISLRNSPCEFSESFSEQVTAPGSPVSLNSESMTACNTNTNTNAKGSPRNVKKSSKGGARNGSSKRSNERKIGYVLEQVAKWRRMYKNGTQKDGKLVGFSLQEAAKVIGISKKSLDDYLLQIRYGKKFGFDFEKNSDQGVGILRAYNKKHRDRLTLKKKPETEDDWMNFQPKCFAPFEDESNNTEFGGMKLPSVADSLDMSCVMMDPTKSLYPHGIISQ